MNIYWSQVQKSEPSDSIEFHASSLEKVAVMARTKSWGARAGNAKFGLGVEQELVQMLPHLTDFNLKSWLPNAAPSRPSWTLWAFNKGIFATRNELVC